MRCYDLWEEFVSHLETSKNWCDMIFLEGSVYIHKSNVNLRAERCSWESCNWGKEQRRSQIDYSKYKYDWRWRDSVSIAPRYFIFIDWSYRRVWLLTQPLSSCKQSTLAPHMFSRIPQKFSSFLGDEAKLAFPTQPGGISKLATVRVRDLPSQLSTGLMVEHM